MGDLGYAEHVLKSWKLTTDPVRPSLGELSYFRRRLTERRRNSRILVLGLTPELVDLAVDVGADRTVVMEVRQVAIDVLPQLATREWSDVEFIQDDWRHRRTELVGQFDLLIGHGSLLLLSFPDEWINTLRILRDYLRSDGVALIRTFVMPAEGHQFNLNYERLLNQFEIVAAGSDEQNRLRLFIQLATEIRCTIILAATREDGVVDHEELARITTWVSADLGRRYSGQPIWQTMESEFDLPTAKGYEKMLPTAAPRWNDARIAIEASGFKAQAEFIGDRPVPGCFCIVTATKTTA